MAEAKAWECPYQEKGSGEYAQRCGGSMGHLCHRCRNDETNRRHEERCDNIDRLTDSLVAVMQSREDRADARQKDLLHTVRTYLRGYMNEMNERADARAVLAAMGTLGSKETAIAVLGHIQQAIREGGGDE